MLNYDSKSNPIQYMLSKVTTGYQITIPSVFRKKESINIGDYIDIVEENGKLVISPVTINKRNRAAESFNSIFNEKDGFFSGMTEESVMGLVAQEIKHSRE